MKIKKLMEFLNNDSTREEEFVRGRDDEKIIYIENARLETARERVSEGRELLSAGTQWSDKTMGEILIDLGKLDYDGVQRILECQPDKGLYFGEAAVELGLVQHDDVLQALSIQFGYSYDQNEETLSKDMVMAYSPFGEQAEEFRAIRGGLLSNWLTPEQKVLAIVSPECEEGRSYIAANLALSFSQLERSTLLIDANMRAPRQHDIFNTSRKVGLSKLLAGRVALEDLDVLPDQLSSFQYLSILACGAIPPNAAELLSNNVFLLILRELKKYFDVIIIDAPAATYKADVVSIASAAGSALLVVRSGKSKMEAAKNLASILREAKVNIVGSILNQF